MTILGRLAGEDPEPLTEKDLERVRTRIRASWSGMVTIDRRELELLLKQIQRQRESSCRLRMERW